MRLAGSAIASGVRVRVMNRSSVRRRFYVSHIADRTGRNALGPKLHLQTNVMLGDLKYDVRLPNQTNVA